MIICISSAGKEKSALMDNTFGRCQYFLILDTETEEFKALENSGLTANQGAGIAAGQQMIDEKVDMVITGFVGPNAMKVLQGANINIYKGKGVTIEEEIKLFQEGKLEMIQSVQPAHFGMGNQNRRGW